MAVVMLVIISLRLVDPFEVAECRQQDADAALHRCPGRIVRVAVLIDPPRWPAHGQVWSHLVSDVSLDELHEFAAAAGIPSRGFDHDHYDVPGDRYESLVAAGAVAVDSRELLSRLRAAGLRRPKRDRR